MSDEASRRFGLLLVASVLAAISFPPGLATAIATVTVEAPASPRSSNPMAELPGLGANPHITFPLHAELGSHGCVPSEPINCLTVLPRVFIPPDTLITIYLMVFNYSHVTAVQTAFDWASNWVFFSAIFDCAPGQITTLVPSPPGGPTAGTVATTFNCMTSGQLLVLGRFLMRSGPTEGCLRQVDSSYPNGTHAVDCNLGIDLVPGGDGGDARRGRVCVGPGGVIACAPLHTPVGPSTWGQVKATYR